VASTTAKIGSVPVLKGEPLMVVSAPVLELIVKAEMLLDVAFTTYRNLPDGSTVAEAGVVPAPKKMGET